MDKRQISAAYIRNFIFGVEDSLVSTSGLISGVAASGLPRQTIFLTGIILIFVEAFSMAVGSFLSERSVEDYLATSARISGWSGVVMFFSYFVSGFIPLAPYLMFPLSQAFWVSIGASLVALYCLGNVSAYLSRKSKAREGMRMFIYGGVAILLGVVVGKVVSSIGAFAR